MGFGQLGGRGGIGGARLSSDKSTFLYSVATGALIANLSNPFGPGTTYAAIGTVPGQLSLSGSTIVKGASAAVAASSYSIKVRATSADGKREIADTLTFTAREAPPVLGVLGLSAASATVGQSVVFNITGATPGSTIVATGPDGLVLNSSARTFSGTPTLAGTYSFDLNEILAGAVNSPRATAVTIVVAEASTDDSLIPYPEPVPAGPFGPFTQGNGANYDAGQSAHSISAPFIGGNDVVLYVYYDPTPGATNYVRFTFNNAGTGVARAVGVNGVNYDFGFDTIPSQAGKRAKIAAMPDGSVRLYFDDVEYTALRFTSDFITATLIQKKNFVRAYSSYGTTNNVYWSKIAPPLALRTPEWSNDTQRFRFQIDYAGAPTPTGYDISFAGVPAGRAVLISNPSASVAIYETPVYTGPYGLVNITATQRNNPSITATIEGDAVPLGTLGGNVGDMVDYTGGLWSRDEGWTARMRYSNNQEQWFKASSFATMEAGGGLINLETAPGFQSVSTSWQVFDTEERTCFVDPNWTLLKGPSSDSHFEYITMVNSYTWKWKRTAASIAANINTSNSNQGAAITWAVTPNVPGSPVFPAGGVRVFQYKTSELGLKDDPLNRVSSQYRNMYSSQLSNAMRSMRPMTTTLVNSRVSLPPDVGRLDAGDLAFRQCGLKFQLLLCTLTKQEYLWMCRHPEATDGWDTYAANEIKTYLEYLATVPGLSFASQIKIMGEYGNECSWNAAFPKTYDLIAQGLARGLYGNGAQTAYPNCVYAINGIDIAYEEQNGCIPLRDYAQGTVVFCSNLPNNFKNLFRARIDIQANNAAHRIPPNGSAPGWTNTGWEVIWTDYSSDALQNGGKRVHSEESSRFWTIWKNVLGDRFKPVMGGWQNEGEAGMTMVMNHSSTRSGGRSPGWFAANGGLAYAAAYYHSHNLLNYGVTGYSAFPPSLQAQFSTDPVAWTAGFKAAQIAAIDGMLDTAVRQSRFLRRNWPGTYPAAYEFNKHYEARNYPAATPSIETVRDAFEASNDCREVQRYHMQQILRRLGYGPHNLFELVGQGWGYKRNDANVLNPAWLAIVDTIASEGLARAA